MRGEEVEEEGEEGEGDRLMGGWCCNIMSLSFFFLNFLYDR